MVYLSVPKFRTIAVFQALFFLPASADVDIKLKPFFDGPEFEEYERFLLFEPYSPTPTEARSCYDYCLECFYVPFPSPIDRETCDCEIEATVCGGTIPVDLSSNDKISFHWHASSNDTKYISIKGNERLRVEFQAIFLPCNVEYEQEIHGSDITFEFDDAGLESVSAQKYTYNADESFLILGKYDGSSECEIFTRLQLDPKNGVLDLNFKDLKGHI